MSNHPISQYSMVPFTEVAPGMGWIVGEGSLPLRPELQDAHAIKFPNGKEALKFYIGLIREFAPCNYRSLEEATAELAKLQPITDADEKDLTRIIADSGPSYAPLVVNGSEIGPEAIEMANSQKEWVVLIPKRLKGNVDAYLELYNTDPWWNRTDERIRELDSRFDQWAN